jgi:LCP family protein required for cell wall assembly
MSPRRSPLRAFAGRFTVAFVVAALFMGGAVFAVNYVIDSKLDDVARVDVSTADAPPDGANYLIIGSDTRAFVENQDEEKAFGDSGKESGQRSDTMMVVHVEPGSQRTLLLSFPRDLLVDIPGMGKSRINAAFNEGPDKVIETLQSNFGVEINHYLEVDFQSFQGIVRAIGNVPVYFPYPARDDKTGLYLYIPGCVRLDGAASLAYVRARSLEYYSEEESSWVAADTIPDINRIARQQDFIRRLAGLAVAKSLNNPLTANEIADEVLQNLTIDDDLEKGDIFELIDAFRTINPDDTTSLEFATFPFQDGPNYNGADVLYPREVDDETSPGWHYYVDRLRDFSGNAGVSTASPKPEDVKLKVLNGSGRVNEAAGVIAEFRKLGFEGAGTGNDDRGTITTTEVHYKPGAEAKGRLVLSYIDPDARLVADSDLKGADVAVVLGTEFSTIVTPAATTPTTTAVPGATAGTPAATSTAPQINNQGKLGEPAPLVPPC